MTVDFGSEIGTKKSITQVTDLYRPKDLKEKLVVFVLNFSLKQIGAMMSECLVTGFKNEVDKITLYVPEWELAFGSKLM